MAWGRGRRNAAGCARPRSRRRDVRPPFNLPRRRGHRPDGMRTRRQGLLIIDGHVRAIRTPLSPGTSAGTVSGPGGGNGVR